MASFAGSIGSNVGAGALQWTPHAGLGEVGGESGHGDLHELSASLASGAFVQAPALK